MDLQLTNIEHFSECDVQAKIKQLRVNILRAISDIYQACNSFVKIILMYIK